MFFCLVDNGFNPIWNELCEFNVKNPNVGMLRFEVQDEDVFGERNFIGQAVFPVSVHNLFNKNEPNNVYLLSTQVNCLRTGLRSVSLKNKSSEELELATLLVQLQIKSLESKC